MSNSNLQGPEMEVASGGRFSRDGVPIFNGLSTYGDCGRLVVPGCFKPTASRRSSLNGGIHSNGEGNMGGHPTWLCLPILALTAGLLLQAGCASAPAPKPAAVSTQPAPVSQVLPAQPVPEARISVPDSELVTAAARPSLPFEGAGWRSLFNAEDLEGWRVTPFAGRGEVDCPAGLLLLNMGDPFTGVNWTNEFPKVNYEIALDAMRVMGQDFFCGLTVPVGDSFISLIVGGWGGSLMGISSVDGMDASENETMKFVNFESKRWYRIRLRVTQRRIQAWLDQERLIDLDTTGRRLSLRIGEIEMSKPMGIATWQTSGAFRNLKLRELKE